MPSVPSDPKTRLPPIVSIQRFLQARNRARERCELCEAGLTDAHPHLVERATRRLCCSCEPCALRFDGPGLLRFRRVPSRAEALADFALTEDLWEALGPPIHLAFFLRSTAEGHVLALYPGPAGATEAIPAPEAWEELVRQNRVLQEFEPDIEGLLINRLGAGCLAYRLSLDRFYRLVGVFRSHWRGLSGGSRVGVELARFFDQLSERSSVSHDSCRT